MKLNLYGQALQACSRSPLTGWKRDGQCSWDPNDGGTHIVCAKVTRVFLEFTYTKGNDLLTPRGSFPGLREGQFWCVCAFRWLEAYLQDPRLAPPIKFESTDLKVLDFIPLDILHQYRLSS